MPYSKSQLYYIYIWPPFFLEDNELHLDETPFDLTNGYEVLAIANFYFNMYRPDNSLKDLYKVESLLRLLPNHIRLRKDVVYWLDIMWSKFVILENTQ